MCRQKDYAMDDGLRTIAEIVVQNQADGVFVVAISGGSCSGKTFLCDRLELLLAEQGAASTRLALDDYFRDIDDPKLPRGNYDEPLFDAPGSYHEAEIIEHLVALTSGHQVEGPVYDTTWNQRVPGKSNKKGAERVILIDGLFAISFASKVDVPRLDVFVEASASTRLARRITRESRLYRVDPELSELVFWNTVEPAHQRHVESQRSVADLVIYSAE